MDKVMKAEIEKILEGLLEVGYEKTQEDYEDNKIAIAQATSSLISLIIKWLESKRKSLKEYTFNSPEDAIDKVISDLLKDVE